MPEWILAGPDLPYGAATNGYLDFARMPPEVNADVDSQDNMGLTRRKPRSHAIITRARRDMCEPHWHHPVRVARKEYVNEH